MLHFRRMGQTITIRLTKDLADWLQLSARRMGVSQGKIVRDQLEKAKARATNQAFLRLAGTLNGPRNLSSRKGFSRS